jgi:hypothetical protein
MRIGNPNIVKHKIKDKEKSTIKAVKAASGDKRLVKIRKAI